MNDPAPAAPPGFEFRGLFRRILGDLGLKASTVARELQRERSLMYKWLSGTSVPPSSYVPLLVQVVMKHSSQAKRLILEENLRAIVREAELPGPLRASLLRSGSFEEILAECLDLSLTPNLADAVPRTARRIGLPSWSVLLAAVFAAVFGGIVWNALNRLLGWPYYMGSAGEALRGWRAFVWGLVTMAPIPAAVLPFGPAGARTRSVVSTILFMLAGAASALLFYSFGAREAVERLGFGYALRESIVVVIYALVLAVPPHFAALAAGRRRPGIAPWLLILLAPAAALAALLVTLVIDRPVSEVLQLRGFVVGFALRIAQFISLFVALVPGG